MVGTKIHKDQAYCLELERIVTIDEVWELTFGKNRLNKELTFQCSVEGCGARMIKRNFNSWGSYGATFRRYPREKHIHPKVSQRKKIIKS